MVEIINSLEELCRLCAGKIDVLMGLNIFASDHRQIFKKICVCLPIQISVDDNFPKMVCVECACKLDLMFDFRERSILTAHLFSDMMTVNNGDIVNISQTLPLENEEVIEETVFTNDFMSCKIEAVKYNNDLATELCPISENIIHEETLDLEETNEAVLKENSESEVGILKKQEDSPELTKQENLNKSEQNLNSEIQAHDITKAFESERTLGSNSESTENIQAEAVVCGTETQTLPGFDWFYCSICNTAIEDKETFELHSQEHLTERSDVKEEEKTELSSPNKKKKTKQKKNNKVKCDEKKNENKVCTECGKEYQTNYKLQEHMRKHTGEKPFLCSYQDCKKAFRSKIGLAQHEANHSGQFEFSCSTCGKGFQCKSYLVVHQRVHSDLKPFACKQCSRRFKTKQSLLDHMNRHLGVKPYLCDICGRGFITKGLCKSHQKVHSGTDNRQYPCQVCRKLFVSKSYLNTHFRIHTGEKPFMCEVCGKGFLTRVDLRIHSTMHTGEKKFVCEMCGKAFARRDALRCHRRSHTGERPYKCEFCGQSFTQFSPMAIHKRLHTGERPYICDVCNKTFVSRSTMIAHRKKHHATNNDESQFQFPQHEEIITENEEIITEHEEIIAEHEEIIAEHEEIIAQHEEIIAQEEIISHEELDTEKVVVLEDSPQLLLALRKRHSVIGEPNSEIISLHKFRSEESAVAVE